MQATSTSRLRASRRQVFDTRSTEPRRLADGWLHDRDARRGRRLARRLSRARCARITYAIGAEQVALTYRRMPQHTGSKGSYGHRHKTQEELYFVDRGQAPVQARGRDRRASARARRSASPPDVVRVGLERRARGCGARDRLDADRRPAGRHGDARGLLARVSPLRTELAAVRSWRCSRRLPLHRGRGSRVVRCERPAARTRSGPRRCGPRPTWSRRARSRPTPKGVRARSSCPGAARRPRRDRCPYVGDQAVSGMTLLVSTPSDCAGAPRHDPLVRAAQHPDGVDPGEPVRRRRRSTLFDYNAYWVEDALRLRPLHRRPRPRPAGLAGSCS